MYVRLKVQQCSPESTQCGIYGNLLSRFFSKNLVKATHLLNKSLKNLFDGKKIGNDVRVNFSCSHAEWKNEKFSITKYFIKSTL